MGLCIPDQLYLDMAFQQLLPRMLFVIEPASPSLLGKEPFSGSLHHWLLKYCDGAAAGGAFRKRSQQVFLPQAFILTVPVGH